MAVPELHPEVRSLSFTLGDWRGAGRGEYPTIEPFDYDEELSFSHVGDSYLVYEQRSSAPADGAPLHLERGFYRLAADGELEVTLAHPLGLVEVAHGHVSGAVIQTSTDDGLVGRTRTGLDVTAIRRRYEFDGDRLRYRIDMATERTPLTLHLEGELRRVRAGPDASYAGESGDVASVG